MTYTTPITVEIVNFIGDTNFDALPQNVLARGRVHILDALGLALAGSRTPATRSLIN